MTNPARAASPIQHHPVFSQFSGFPSTPPAFDEEYFEWIDMLESVTLAQGQYRFAELGSAYGRWTARALQAAKFKGLTDIHGVMVEAEPKHAQDTKPYMDKENIPPECYQLFEAAVGGAPGIEHFIVEGPHGLSPDEWYGQALNKAASLYGFQPSSKKYGAGPDKR